ncbi:putative peroxidase-related enzyme [Paenochrobactrum gallinarii]|uniref:Putative peroxidase-related enzyme n=1 Tax=Paenochrobactrum gallinarii TaxID=643673 RepID=A0A841M5I1_9HYPH|nr:peroxidase-related enzyme [Paenochrobactrum gallinarii]MBB6261408.1 putative peroxidase-related enzyme [Paenochrobactrum gallinarii]
MSEVIHKFTKTVPEWRPRVKPVVLAEASPEQLDALKVTPSNTKVSDYVLVLAHDPESLNVRSPLFNAVMYGKGGLGRAERELGALGASVVNQCIYCAAVHAQRHAQLSRDESVTDKLFLEGEKAQLDPKNQAIFDFALKLSQFPPKTDGADAKRLAEVGLNKEEAVDLVLSTAMFGWANRLMHVLGDPVK